MSVSLANKVILKGVDLPVLVMVHGWPDEPRLWDSVVAQMASSYRCVCLRLPWHVPDAPHQIMDLAAIVRWFDTQINALGG